MAQKLIYKEHKPQKKPRHTPPTPTLPQPITYWTITPSPYTPNTNLLTFYTNNNPTAHMEVTPETAEDLTTTLNTILHPHRTYPDLNEIPPTTNAPEIFAHSTVPDNWLITKPENPNNPPHLYFTENNEITTIIPLTPQTLTTLTQQLNKLTPNPPTPKNWLQTHPKTAILGAATIIAFLIYSILTTYF